MLKPDDHERVHRAIAEAEARTAGEIFCVVATQSAAYHEVPIAWAALVALAGPPVALLSGLRPAMLVSRIEGGWLVDGHGAIERALTTGAVAYGLGQAVLFALVLAVVAIPAVRRALTPGFVKTAHVHARAIELFVHRRHASAAPASIMIYASSTERRVEIVGDDDIHAAVGEAFWKAAVSAAIAKIKAGDAADGLVTAVTMCGDALARHFPPTGAPRASTGDDVTEI